MTAPANATRSPYTYEQMKTRQQTLGPTGPAGPLPEEGPYPGGEPDYNAPALEPEADTTSVAAPVAATPPTSSLPHSRYEKRLNEYREKVYWPEYEKYASDRIRRLYPNIPTDAEPSQVLSRYKQAFASDMSDENFYTKLDETHARGFKPSIEEPKPNLIETAGMVATPENLAEMGKGIVHFGGGQAIAGMAGKGAEQAAKNLPAWMTKSVRGAAPAARSLARVAGQAAMTVPTGIKLAGAQLAGTQLEKTAREMPTPNIAALQAKGYSPAQIQNVLRGYADVQKELYGTMEETGKEGVSAAAEGIANAALFGYGGEKIAKAVTRVMSGAPVAAKVGKVAASVISGTVAHGATGATLGAGYGAVHGATERMAKAKAMGAGAYDIFKAGMAGAMEEGITGPPEMRGVSGATIGAAAGTLFGAPAAMFTTARAAAKTASVARKAIEEARIKDAQVVNLNKFAEQFQPHQLPERFPEDLAAATGDDVALANNIVGGVWGSDVAATEHGQRAASRIYEKIRAWRNTRDQLSGAMIDLGPAKPQPAAIEDIRVPGLVTGAPGVETVQPNVVGEYRPTPEMQPAPAPQGVAPLPGLQPIGAAVPAPAVPLAVEKGAVSLATPMQQQPIPQIGQPLGVIEQGGRVAPATEVSPRMLESKPAVAPIQKPVIPALPPAPAVEPNPIKLPTRAEQAITALGENEHVTISPSEKGDAIKIEKLGVTAGTLAKPGASSEALSNVNAVADEHGLPVEAQITEQAGPRGGKIPLAKLLPWYEKHGYKVVSQGEGMAVVRREPSLPAVAERVKDLPPAEAALAAGNVKLGEPMPKGSLADRMGVILDKARAAAEKRIKARGTRLMSGIDPEDVVDHSVILAADMFSYGMRSKPAVTNWLVEHHGEAIRPHVDEIYNKAQKRLTKMFKTESRATTKLNELVALRDAGTHGMDWYEETANWVHKTFGDDANMFIKFLAITSADNSTEGGAALAMKAFAQWKQGLPFDGMRGPHMVGMLEKAVRGEPFGEGKISSFHRALAGDKDAVVLDRWMIRALGLPTTSNLSPKDYELYSQIVRNLAGDAKMSPRQLQAAIWEGSRIGNLHERWKKGGPKAVSKVGSARPLEHLLQKEFGSMTPYQWVTYNKMKLEDLRNMSAGLRAAREQGGYTFNPMTWETDKTPGYVVTLASDVVPKKEFYPAALTNFKRNFQRLISAAAFGGPNDPHLNIGTFDLKDYKPGHYSLDFNVVVPFGPGALEKATQIGKMNRQFEIGEIGPNGEYVQGHKTGYNPKKHGPQFVPPKGGPERREWFKKAAARANTLMDQVSFTLKPKEK